MAKAAKNILTLNHEEAMDFFMKSDQYHGLFGGSFCAMSAICTQIALENVGCVHYALRIISCMIDSLKDMAEKQSIIDLVYNKLCNQPNSDYNQLWLQNMITLKTKNRYITILTSPL